MSESPLEAGIDRNTIELSVACVPVPQPRARSKRFGGQHYTPGKEIVAFKKALLWAYRKAAGFEAVPFDGAVFVSIEAFFPRPAKLMGRNAPDDAILMIKRPDGDNIEKAVLDGLTASRELHEASKKLNQQLKGFPWIDDSQVHIDRVRRYIAAKNAQPGIIVRITNGVGIQCYPPPKETTSRRLSTSGLS